MKIRLRAPSPRRVAPRSINRAAYLPTLLLGLILVIYFAWAEIANVVKYPEEANSIVETVWIFAGLTCILLAKYLFLGRSLAKHGRIRRKSITTRAIFVYRCNVGFWIALDVGIFAVAAFLFRGNDSYGVGAVAIPYLVAQLLILPFAAPRLFTRTLEESGA